VRYEQKDFTPIGLIASQPLVLVAAPAAGVKNAGEFIALLKKNPGKYSYGSSGVGTSLHLAGEMLKQQGGVFMTHVPYRGVAPLTNDLLGGNIDFGVFVLSSALPYIKQRQDGGAGHHRGQTLGHHARPARARPKPRRCSAWTSACGSR
jgi:tripartite-type tricarboxylate transporter receptor subunit TctC